MREIKFRAWDGEKREMFEVSGMRWKDGEVTGDDTAYGDNFLAPAERISGTLMQYTGLKDRNGVEIYEGDIVERYDKDGYRVRGGRSPFVVSWRIKENGIGFNIGEGSSHRNEVIGNAYEHPELIQSTETYGPRT